MGRVSPARLQSTPIMPAKSITLAQEIAEIERELRMRQSVYPDWTKGPSPRLKPDTADHRLACLESTLKRLRALQPEPVKQGTIF